MIPCSRAAGSQTATEQSDTTLGKSARPSTLFNTKVMSCRGFLRPSNLPKGAELFDSML